MVDNISFIRYILQHISMAEVNFLNRDVWQNSNNQLLATIPSDNDNDIEKGDYVWVTKAEPELSEEEVKEKEFLNRQVWQNSREQLLITIPTDNDLDISDGDPIWIKKAIPPAYKGESE